MANTAITVINLSKDIADLFGGQTSVVLDLPIKFSIRLSKSVEQLSVLNKISTEAALGFSVPFTQTNDLIFNAYASPVTLNFKAVFFSVQVVVNGNALQFTRLLFKVKNDRAKQWELELQRSPDHWVELASQVRTNELEFGSFQMTKANIVGSWSTPAYNGDYTNPNGVEPICWPLVDYGGWCDQETPIQGVEGDGNRVKAVGVEDFRPWLSLIYILRAGFCKIGWTLNSVLFELDVFKRLWVYALRQDYYVASQDQLGGRITGQIHEDARVNQGEFILLDQLSGLSDYAVIQTGLDLKRFCGIKNYPGIALKYRFFLKATFHNNRSLPFTAFFSVMEIEDTGSGFEFTGEVLSTESLQVDFAPNETKSITFDQIITLKAGQMGAIHIPVLPTTTPGFFVKKGGYFAATPENNSYMTFDMIDVRLSVSDEMTILDWTKAFVHLCNGRLSTDWETKTVTIYPNRKANVWGEVASGFLLVEQPVIDLETKIVPDSNISKPVRTDLKRFTRFGFKPSTDAKIKSLNLLQPTHSRMLLNDVDLPNQVEDIFNPFIEPTIEVKPQSIGSGAGGRNPLPWLPALWDNTSGERSFAIAPRILYAYGSVRQVNPAPITSVNELTSFFFNQRPNPENTGLQTNFGYFTQSPTWAVTPTPTNVVDIVFGTKYQDLFTTFYLGYTQDNRSGTIIDLLMMMKVAEYLKYDFRQLFRFRVEGLPIIAPMVSIRDFSSDEPGISTPVQFFVSPADLECCDRPCGCQFIECDYYQDFGITIHQATLDNLLISSFIVDGLELLTAPISFGIIKIIDIGGRPYVTNFVDKLNTIGAPYFSFSYSDRLHPDRGLRFFKIKRLVCTTFKILITGEGGADAYEYTESSQLQKIFSETWDAIGYGEDSYDAPDNCLQTTEY